MKDLNFWGLDVSCVVEKEPPCRCRFKQKLTTKIGNVEIEFSKTALTNQYRAEYNGFFFDPCEKISCWVGTIRDFLIFVELLVTEKKTLEELRSFRERELELRRELRDARKQLKEMDRNQDVEKHKKFITKLENDLKELRSLLKVSNGTT